MLRVCVRQVRAMGGTMSVSGLSSLTAFEQAVGQTPLLRLRGASEAAGCNVYAKAEYANPGGSVKDRPALSMILGAERDGHLVRGEEGVIVEGTAGNTGIGLALAGRALGYKVLICIASSQSQEKKDMLRWAGAELVEVPPVPYADPNNYVHVAARLADAIANKLPVNSFYANQWDNLDNRAAHASTTGPEIMRQIADAERSRDGEPGVVTAFSAAMGTGGTLTGVAEALRAANPHVHIALTDPHGAGLYRYYTEGELKAVGSSISEGIGQNRITGNMVGFEPDAAHEISDADMMLALEILQSCDGLAMGTSSGINVAGAIQVGRELGPDANVVTILCDVGARYAGKLYSPNFLRSVSLTPPPWIDEDDAGLGPPWSDLLADVLAQ
ncbi:cysteine synthase [Thecamonas trahens ATCC 50062]|uniref:Cysteine synthase n=1 Tax=Thecamonas trahens ATCC 50062 TaxID=461836 RepID=A0A0L0DSI2_THETB|nr:cysteine synthase [Thecamonas trahens ATCC 50062]KNC55304.1 cysteine synthase [Thecamonas trahens ATCC 50062]|eukprot:XP_013753124.1 cysteine synthase [Thecamonas trahens ATCC 50062]